MADRCGDDIHFKELSTILRFSALIASSLRIEVVLDNAMKWAEDFMDAEASSVYEVDEEKKELFVCVARGEKKEPVKQLTLKIGEGIAGYVVLTKRPKIVQDVRKSKRFSDKFDRITGFKTRSMICVPLVLRDHCIGALQVLNKRAGKRFTRNDLELLTSMSQLIAVAMENANLYRRLQERFELTEEELKKTQGKLIRSERLAAMGHLVQGVAHEIRNPVMTIGGFAQRIRREIGEDNRLTQYTEIIVEETARLENLVQKVRQLAEVQSSSLVLGDAEMAVSEAAQRIAPLAERQGVTLRKETPGELPPILMDRIQLVTALYNVLENALESMSEGGSLVLKAVLEDHAILISVADTGCGIDPHALEALYDPFVTSKARGAGLGLTMVYQIITNHNGEIKIHSELKKGTTVEIRLPVPTLSKETSEP